jgi:hypothetical protein
MINEGRVRLLICQKIAPVFDFAGRAAYKPAPPTR